MADKKKAQKPHGKRKPDSSSAARGSGREGAGLSMREQQVIRLQQQVGNTGTKEYLGRTGEAADVQRRQVSLPTGSETLHNEEGASGQFTSNRYRVGTRGVNYEPQGIRYQMTRAANRVNVNVRIKFVQLFGSDTAAATPIPEGQPRTVARDMCTQLLTYWNTSNRFELIGTRQPTFWDRVGIGEGPGEPTEVRLPVRFGITPVFDLGASAHATVQLDTVNPGNAGAGRVVNASHWYSQLDPASYAGGIGDTYAHEFGHLLGIPDEYSLGNPAAHQLMHRLSPNAATQANLDRSIDDAGVREMILAALRPQIQAQLRGQAGNLSSALMAQRDQIVREIADRLRDVWADPGTQAAVREPIHNQLEAAGQTRALNRLPDALRFEATDNLSNLTIARRMVDAEMSPHQLGLLLSSMASQAARNAEERTISLNYQDEGGQAASLDVGIDVASGVSAAGSPLAASAQQAAQEAVGTPAAGGAAGAAANLYPSDTLMNQLTALPASWTDVASEMGTQLTEMPTAIQEAADNILGSTDLSASVNDSVRELYTALYNFVTSVSNAAAQATVRNFLRARFYPLVENKVNDLMSDVEAEISRHHTASGTGTTAAPGAPPVPALMTAVQQMQQTARTMVNPAAPAGGGVADQNVTYTAHSLMGANSEGTSLRAEQLSTLAEQFNAGQPDLRRANEDRFTIRTAR